MRLASLSWTAAVGAVLLAAALPAAAGAVAERVKKEGTVRVCIAPGYYGITFRSPRDGQLRGIDIDLAKEFAKWLGVQLQFVDSSYVQLKDDITAGTCDIAMFGLAVTEERKTFLRFSQPYLESGIYGVATRSSRVVRNWADIDQPGVKVAVLAGTFMVPVMEAALKKAQLVVIRPPLTREAELEAGRVDVFMTDYPFSRRLLASTDWARLVSPPQPFHPVPYAYAVKPGDDEWARKVDDFVAQIKRDGRLDAAARRAGLSEIVVGQ